MNNENTNLVPIPNSADNPVVPEANSASMEEAVAVEATTPVIQTVDPTASFQTVDPTASFNAPANFPKPVTETSPEPKPVVTENTTEILLPEESTTTPNTTPTTLPQTRYNPVTGEEMSVSELLGTPAEEAPKEEVKLSATQERIKQANENYKPTSKGNTIMLIIFFIVLILFVVFLPDLQNLIALYKSGPVEVEEITTGTLVCTLESSTVNLDRTITRKFGFVDNKLQNAKFETVIRGDASLDEEALDELNAACEQIKENVEGIEGVTVSCNYEEGKLEERESFDYATYDVEKTSAAYTEAGGSVLEFTFEQDINQVMTNMRQGGFTCNKEK